MRMICPRWNERNLLEKREARDDWGVRYSRINLKQSGTATNLNIETLPGSSPAVEVKKYLLALQNVVLLLPARGAAKVTVSAITFTFIECMHTGDCSSPREWPVI